jgi:hypothetical protein
VKPADRVALLTALVEAAKKELDRAKVETLTVADTVGVKTFASEFGQVTIGQKQPAPFVADPGELLAYVKHTYPTEVVTAPQVRPSFVTALLQRVEWAPELNEYIDPESGEAIPGLAMSQPGDPYVTWPSGDAQKRTKEEAAAWFASRSEQILAGMRLVEAGPES